MIARRRIFKSLIITIAWFLIWQGASMAVGSSLLLPSPFDAFSSLARLVTQGAFWESTLFTLLRISGGFILGMSIGTALAVLSAASSWADAFLSPLRDIVKATPVTSFIILVLLWLSTGITPLFISFLMVLPIAWTNVYEGIKAVDPKLVEMGRVFRLSAWDNLRSIYAPSVRPYFSAASTTGLGLAWKAGVAAEVIALPSFSIGRSLYESKIYLETPDLFAWTAVVVIVSMLLEHLVVRLMRRNK